MHVSILVFDGCIALPSIGSLEILLGAGRMALEIGADPEVGNPFTPELVACSGRSVVSADGLPVTCHRSIDQVGQTDLVLVPALGDDPIESLRENARCLPWLRQVHHAGADIASICTGAFLLAEAGLLTGRKATTHWIAQELFASRYPEVTVLQENIIVDEGSVITSGGATTFLNLLMYLVEKYCGQEAARYASRVFLIDQGRGPQTSFAIFSTQKSHKDDLVLRAQEFLEGHHGKPLVISAVARHIGVSRRNLERRFKSATGNTPREYLQRVRIEGAKKALETTGHPVSEIAHKVGYGDVPSFRKVFQKTTGLSPARYRSRYSASQQSPYVSRAESGDQETA